MIHFSKHVTGKSKEMCDPLFQIKSSKNVMIVIAPLTCQRFSFPEKLTRFTDNFSAGLISVIYMYQRTLLKF